jgi:hypothetical protein
MCDISKILSRWRKQPPEPAKVGEMEEESIRVKLSIKPLSKVCLFHAPKDLLPPFMKGDLKLMLDWAENECDSIIYWVLQGDDLKNITLHLEKQIKPSGRIWIVVQEDKAARKGSAGETIAQIQGEVTEYTNLLKGKVVAIGSGASAIQFVLRKDAKEPKE